MSVSVNTSTSSSIYDGRSRRERERWKKKKKEGREGGETITRQTSTDGSILPFSINQSPVWDYGVNGAKVLVAVCSALCRCVL